MKDKSGREVVEGNKRTHSVNETIRGKGYGGRSQLF